MNAPVMDLPEPLPEYRPRIERINRNADRLSVNHGDVPLIKFVQACSALLWLILLPDFKTFREMKRLDKSKA